MSATEVNATVLFSVVKGDTYPVPTIELIDADGGVVDPAGSSFILKRWDVAGIETDVAGVIDAMTVTFPWPAGDTDEGKHWETMVSIDDTTNVYTLVAPDLYVHDPATMYCTVSDVVAIVGPGYSQYEVLRAIEVAENVVGSLVTTPVGSPVPERVRQATAILAARVLTTDPSSIGGSGGDIVEERIQDYSVRYSEGDSYYGPYIDDTIIQLLLPWRMKVYSSNVAEPRQAEDDDGDYEYLGYVP